VACANTRFSDSPHCSDEDGCARLVAKIVSVLFSHETTGFELNVLRGAKKLLEAKAIKKILMEVCVPKIKKRKKLKLKLKLNLNIGVYGMAY
jgi:hypothetical protein